MIVLSSAITASPCVPVEAMKKAEYLPFHSRPDLRSTGISNGVGLETWVPKLVQD